MIIRCKFTHTFIFYFKVRKSFIIIHRTKFIYATSFFETDYAHNLQLHIYGCSIGLVPMVSNSCFFSLRTVCTKELTVLLYG
jgi:hypothetical protein